MEKALELQKQIRQNADEYRDFVKDLTRWEDKVKNDDKNLQTERRIEEKLPPIRKKDKKKLMEDDPQKKKEEGSNKRISSYDYDAWSKFDVETACKNIDEDSPEEEMESESEDEEEQERIREERNIQHAHVEKEKGNQLFKEGKYEAAINRYTKAISLHASNPILYANRGMALIKTEKYGAAEEDCSRSLELDPNYTKALARRATARRKLKKYSSAIEDYKRLLSIEPKNKQALTEIAEIGKILTKENEKPKDISKEEIRINKAESKPVPNNEEKRKRRSNKPLKRIHIEEIGLEEEIANIKAKSSFTPASIPIPKVEVPLTIPSSSVTFEREFKRLRSDEELLYKYMKLIPVEQYSKLIQCIDVLLSPFLKILAKFYIRDDLNVHEELKALSTVRRFDMVMMFLARDDKKYIEELFNYISSAGYPTEQVTVKEIKKKYGMRV